MISRVLLRAHVLKSVGPGQRYLVEREWHSDGRVMQRVNAGVPVKEDEWHEVGRWGDLATERRGAQSDGWDIDDSQ